MLSLAFLFLPCSQAAYPNTFCAQGSHPFRKVSLDYQISKTEEKVIFKAAIKTSPLTETLTFTFVVLYESVGVAGGG